MACKQSALMGILCIGICIKQQLDEFFKESKELQLESNWKKVELKDAIFVYTKLVIDRKEVKDKKLDLVFVSQEASL